MRRQATRLIVGLAVLVCGATLTASPAVAQVSGGAGVVDGAVSIAAPGIDLTPRITAYNFAPIMIAGAIASPIGGTFVGCIATGFAVGGFGVGPFGIVWPQGGETVLGGAGNVAQFAVAGSPCPA